MDAYTVILALVLLAMLVFVLWTTHATAASINRIMEL